LFFLIQAADPFIFSAQPSRHQKKKKKTDHSPSETSEKLRVGARNTQKTYTHQLPVFSNPLIKNGPLHFHPYALSVDTKRHYFLFLAG
jgi:hypothetical protein